MQFGFRFDIDSDGSLHASVPGVPGVHTFGQTKEEASRRAVDALETMLMGMIADGEHLPNPTPAAGDDDVIHLSLLTAGKVALHRAMLGAGVGMPDLARRLGWNVPQVDRILDLRHASRPERLEKALSAVGKRIRLEVVDVPRLRTQAEA